MNDLSARRRTAALATVCLAVFAINIDTTIVNVALPDLSRQLHAGTGSLQWVVDGYNLAFAALVLAGGSVGDRLGRRPVLLAGLAGFAVTSLGAAFAGSTGSLVFWRVAMGACAALIYPTTLSIIANLYPDRSERAKAIGVWGAVTGIGVAVGPVLGGLLLSHFGWESVFVALVPAAVTAAVLAFVLVPESRIAGAARLDIQGLLSSSAAIALLVYTIIEAPVRGWTSVATLVGFTLAAVIAALFVWIERRKSEPMLDVGLFRVPAFSAASGSVTIAFFALFGFIFLVTQYMQFVRGWGALSTGMRILPVAAAIGISSTIGPILAGRIGTRVVVVTGLLAFGASFAWIASSSTVEPYDRIAFQMLLMGAGLGLTSTPATESILSVLPAAKAGVGSAVNDATRETGGTLGVAVIGSVFTSAFVHHLSSGPVAHLPTATTATARSSVGAALAIAHSATSEHAPALVASVTDSFMSGFRVGCLVAAAICVAGALGALRLPGRGRSTVRELGSDSESNPSSTAVLATVPAD